MKIQRLSWMLSLALGVVAVQEGTAQVFMSQAVIGTGGGRTASSATAMDATMGQTVVGHAESATTSGDFGFWFNEIQLSSVLVPGGGAGAVTALSVVPNPVAGSSSVDVTLATGGPVDVILYDASGREVRVLFSGTRDGGTFSLPLDAAGLPGGTYFMAVRVPGGLLQQPVTVVR